MAVPDHVFDTLRKPGVRIALVGASSAPEKYGNKIYKDLTSRGYTVLPVNSSGAEIEGQASFKTVADVPAPIDILNVVIPPKASLGLVKALDPATTKVLWFQPGSFDEEVVAAAEERFDTVIAGDCIMVVTRAL